MRSYQRHKQRQFWIQVMLNMSESMPGMTYDSLREKDVVEFFYLFKQFELKNQPKPESDGR